MQGLKYWQKTAWKEIFTQMGVRPEDYMKVSKTQFKNRCNFAIESGFGPPVEGIDYAERRKWVAAFSQIGIHPPQVFSMENDEFSQKQDFIVETGISAPPKITHPMPKDSDEELEEIESSNSDSPVYVNSQSSAPSSQSHFAYRSEGAPQSLLLDQDEEYRKYELREKEAEKKRQAQEKKKKEQEEAEKKTKAHHEENAFKMRELILEEARTIALEPTDPKQTITVAVRLPEGKRVTRKFAKSCRAAEIYQWIAAQDEMFNGRTPLHFELRQFTGDGLEKDKILSQQITSPRVLYTVVLLD